MVYLTINGVLDFLKSIFYFIYLSIYFSIQLVLIFLASLIDKRKKCEENEGKHRSTENNYKGCML